MNFIEYLFQWEGDLGSPCLIAQGRAVTHRELRGRVDAISSWISDKFGRGNEFLLLSDNDPFFIESYLSIIRSGNIPLLVETRISESDLSDVLARSTPAAVFCQRSLLPKLPEGVEVMTETDLPSQYTSRTHEGNDPADLAAVIFTSGSTGRKKGVMISHRNLVANTDAIVQYLQLTSMDRMLTVLPFYYCYGASLLHTHIRVGGSLVLFKKNFLGAVPDEIDRHGCTGFAGVPSTFQILMGRSDFLSRPMPSLRYMTQAGGKLENRYIEELHQAFPGKKVIVMYGATEATARMSYLPPEMLPAKIGSIGKGIPGVALSVLSPDGKAVLPGEVGEIVARGDNIMIGYYKDQEGTDEVLDKLGYHTGDLATVDADGFIYIVGRSKDIIKSAGFRISPGEIENLICTLPEVGACAVVGVPDEVMGEAVVAIAVPRAGSDPNALRVIISDLVRSHLPSYKVPKEVVFMESMPLNTSNKVDKLALREMLAAGKGRKLP